MPSLAQAQPFTRNHKLRDAIGQALYDAMVQDESIHCFGEGAQVKIHYDAPRIESDFPDRVHTMPISEDANTNFAVGASLLGVKPVVDVISADFLYRTMDSICNTAAKQNFLRAEKSTIVIRAEFLTNSPTTGQRPESMFAHVPGLRVVVPSTPRDAYGLMRTALTTPGVTLFFEDRMIRDDGHFTEDDMVCNEVIPFGKVSMCRYGQRGQPLILTYGVMRQVVERALQSWSGVRVLDLRTLYPIDWDALKWNINRHWKILIVEPDITYGGVGAEIVATLAQENCGLQFKRLGAPMATIPAAMSLHSQMMPSEQEIIDAIRSFN